MSGYIYEHYNKQKFWAFCSQSVSFRAQEDKISIPWTDWRKGEGFKCYFSKTAEDNLTDARNSKGFESGCAYKILWEGECQLLSNIIFIHIP